MAGPRTARTPQTLVMPFGDDRAMVTDRPGRALACGRRGRARAACVAANLEQIDLVPDGTRGYITCGDDDARAFARRLPPAISRTPAFFLDRSDALVLSGENTLEDAVAMLAQSVETVVAMDGAHGMLTMLGATGSRRPTSRPGRPSTPPAIAT